MSSIISKVIALLIKRRWLFMILFGMTVIIVEALEHILTGESIFTLHYGSEVLIYGVAIPLFGVFLIDTLDRLEGERNRALQDLDDRLAFNRRLMEAASWEEVVQKIVQLPGSIITATSTSLSIYNPLLEQYEQVAFIGSDGHGGGSQPQIARLDCRDCSHALLSTSSVVNKCQHLNEHRSPDGPQSYCMPLSYRGSTLAMLFIDLYPNQELTPEQSATLTNIAPEMALALESANLERLAQSQAQVLAKERQHIAQDLHDTLGQNLSFLRLKLDQISTQASFVDIAQIRDDLGQMRAQADEAYLRMRDTLADLHPGSEEDLESGLRSQVETVTARTNLSFEFNRQGEPVRLRPHVVRQILYICREALNNMEKYACAQTLTVDLIWSPAEITLRLKDDGVGFDPKGIFPESGYGFTIMTERAEAIQAQLTITSAPLQGTEVILRLPLVVGTGEATD